MEQDSGFVQDSSSSALDNDLSRRWEQLKPIILNLYLEQDMHLSTVVNIMRNQHNFHAVENSYKYYFSQWGVSKNIPGTVKDAAILALGKRIRDSNSTPAVHYNGQVINKKRLRRHISAAEKKKEDADSNFQLSSNVFMVWNLPYRAFRSSSAIVGHFSPFPDTPAFIHIASPHLSQSPRNLPSPDDAPTPTVLAVRNKELNERARLFVQARHEDLFRHMVKPEKKILTTYMYQFWFFAFKTAKNWGYGPLDWTADLLEFDRFKDKDLPTHSSPNTPGSNVGTPAHAATPRSEGSAGNLASLTSHPSPLCNWTIHAAIRNRFEGEETLNAEYDENIAGPDGEDTWSRWPKTRQTFEEKLQAALESNSFSNLDPGDLPMTLTQITKATRRSPKELLQEGFGFSLVARNEEVFWELLPRAARTNFEGSGIYPLHLLTSFLDGSKTCCNLLDAALNHIAEENSTEKLYVNNHEHTVLDSLMMSILKGHTSCRPVAVDDKFAKLKRFTGEEVDICGRWDADSDCIREVFAEGHAAIPIEWKHMFCHTSVQTICHCIGRLFGPVFAPPINFPSGLFTKHCQSCGMKLQLLPLHSLVLTTVHVARSGCPEESLFGMLACLVCLLVNGANPTYKAHISLDALMNRDSAAACSHEDLDPLQLAELVPDSLMVGWTEEVILGWQVFCSTLRYARDERRPRSKQISKRRDRDDDFNIFLDVSDDEMSGNEDSEDEDKHDQSDVEEELCSHSKTVTGNFYGGSKAIGILWAAIQTELVTYRRLTQDDPWISEYFDMRSLLDGLNNGGLISIPLVDRDMMSPFCKCGRFLEVTDEACACVDEVCDYVEHFANLDSAWSRTAYIMIPEGHNDSWYEFF